MTNFCCNCIEPLDRIAIICAECKNIKLCLMCFKRGIEIGNHRNNHKYQVKDNSKNVIFRQSDPSSNKKDTVDWTYEEEILFNKLLMNTGENNWNDISKLMTNRSSKEIEEHYKLFYVNGIMAHYTNTPNRMKYVIKETTCTRLKLKPDSIENKVVPLTDEQIEYFHYAPFREEVEYGYNFKESAEKIIANLYGDTDKFRDCIYTDYKLVVTMLYMLMLKQRTYRTTTSCSHQFFTRCITKSDMQKDILNPDNIETSSRTSRMMRNLQKNICTKEYIDTIMTDSKFTNKEMEILNKFNFCERFIDYASFKDYRKSIKDEMLLSKEMQGLIDVMSVIKIEEEGISSKINNMDLLEASQKKTKKINKKLINTEAQVTDIEAKFCIETNMTEDSFISCKCLVIMFYLSNQKLPKCPKGICKKAFTKFLTFLTKNSLISNDMFNVHDI